MNTIPSVSEDRPCEESGASKPRAAEEPSASASDKPHPVASATPLTVTEPKERLRAAYFYTALAR